MKSITILTAVPILVLFCFNGCTSSSLYNRLTVSDPKIVDVTEAHFYDHIYTIRYESEPSPSTRSQYRWAVYNLKNYDPVYGGRRHTPKIIRQDKPPKIVSRSTEINVHRVTDGYMSYVGGPFDDAPCVYAFRYPGDSSLSIIAFILHNQKSLHTFATPVHPTDNYLPRRNYIPFIVALPFTVAVDIVTSPFQLVLLYLEHKFFDWN